MSTDLSQVPSQDLVAEFEADLQARVGASPPPPEATETTPLEEAHDAPEREEPPEPTPETPAVPTSWITDEVRDLAKVRGIDAEELGTLSGIEEFRRLSKLMAKRQQAAPATEPEATATATPATDDDPMLAALDPERFQQAGYDADIQQLAGVARDLYRDRTALRDELAQMREEMGAVRQERAMEQFHALADTLDAAFYGQGTHLDEAHEAHRKALFEKVTKLRQVEPNATHTELLRQADAALRALQPPATPPPNPVADAERKKKIKEQEATRRPDAAVARQFDIPPVGAGTRPGAVTTSDRTSLLLADPEVMAACERAGLR